ncbi:hypothetical protein SAMN04488074_13641 [Lentzea albidocapillata subsp. violacea]|uniref:SprT-like family protein n=1 Tax=Lentzea albidocapillata subsp. violacea TaxID=128104 RepID=A0A1G9Z0F1_9PSEU|nr:hypothetical protein [Lentzea albidocapillata]SDN14465.1 hypothetical protein SAMN04488074_13641 [Lentzea albidocapillata subsp. violacea]
MTTTEPQAGAGPSLSVQLVTALDATWRAIQARHPEVPDVAITMGSGTTGRRGSVKLGHFAARRWVRRTASESERADVEQHVHELEVGGEGLGRGGLATLETLLHEATHALAEVRKVPDTGDNGRYHNIKFASLARELGLDAANSGNKHGWNATSATKSTAELYAAQVEALDAAITVYRLPDPTSTPGSATSGRMLAAVCGCDKPRRFRIARGVLDLGAITCSVCRKQFTLEGDG